MAKKLELPKAQIIGTGSAVPSKILTNFDLERMVDTSDEWIKTRTGIEKRHIAENGVTTATLGAEAARKALDNAGVSPTDIDLIIVASITPEAAFPSTACYIQDLIGTVNAGTLDINAACSGFIYGLAIADAFILSRKYNNILVIGAETLSRITDWTDRNTCVLFGDGAGAIVITRGDSNDNRGIISTYLRSDGSQQGLLYMLGGGSKYPASYASIDQRLHYIKMNGVETFKAAVTAMGDAAIYILEQSDLNGDEIDWLIPHQANIRIIQATAKRVGLPMSKVYVNVQEYGNTSAASIPIALDEGIKKGLIKTGQTLVMVAFGGGFTWAAATMRL